MPFQPFKDLEVWKRTCAFAVFVCESLKATKPFALKGQMMERASVSIASNIAEFAERGGRDFARFLRIASGSAAELRAQVYIARKLDILTAADFNRILPEQEEISKMLTGLRKSLNSEHITSV